MVNPDHPSLMAHLRNMARKILFILNKQDVPDGSEINCCDRTRATVSGKDTPPDNFYLLASGDDNSKIKICR